MLNRGSSQPNHYLEILIQVNILRCLIQIAEANKWEQIITIIIQSQNKNPKEKLYSLASKFQENLKDNLNSSFQMIIALLTLHLQHLPLKIVE